MLKNDTKIVLFQSNKYRFFNTTRFYHPGENSQWRFDPEAAAVRGTTHFRGGWCSG